MTRDSSRTVCLIGLGSLAAALTDAVYRMDTREDEAVILRDIG